jgi:hypothetical protein
MELQTGMESVLVHTMRSSGSIAQLYKSLCQDGSVMMESDCKTPGCTAWKTDIHDSSKSDS